MEVTNRFLDDVGVCYILDSWVTTNHLPRREQDLLSDCGKFYLVALAQNNIPEICERMRKKYSMNSRVCAVCQPLRGLTDMI